MAERIMLTSFGQSSRMPRCFFSGGFRARLTSTSVGRELGRDIHRCPIHARGRNELRFDPDSGNSDSSVLGRIALSDNAKTQAASYLGFLARTGAREIHHSFTCKGLSPL